MKEELIKQINPITELFVDTLLKKFDDVPKIRKSLIDKEREVSDLAEERKQLLDNSKKQNSIDRAEFDRKITDLENAKIDFTARSTGYDNLNKELKEKSRKVDDYLAKSNMELIRARDSRVQAEKIEGDAQKLKDDYELKLESLNTDFLRVIEDNKKIEEEKKKLSVRENKLFSEETKSEKLKQENMDKELSLKAREKEALKMKNRYMLKESAKE